MPDPKAAAVDPSLLPTSINEPPGSDLTPDTPQEVKQQPAPAKTSARHAGDPDDLEDEIEAAEDDDDVDVKHGKAKPKTKR